MNILGLSNVEWHCVCKIIPFVKTKTQIQSVCHILGYLALTVRPNEYLVHTSDVGQALRTVLERYLWLLKKVKSLSTNLLVDPAIEYVDTFTSCDDTGPLFLAKTETGAYQKEFLGTLESWTYHILMNGPIHPMTRRPIQNFCQVLVSNDASAVIPTLECLRIPSEVQRILEMSLRESFAMPVKPDYTMHDLIDFEEMYGIPDERSMSRYLLHSYFFDPMDDTLWIDEESLDIHEADLDRQSADPQSADPHNEQFADQRTLDSRTSDTFPLSQDPSTQTL
jgi:hypothetical protein